MDFARQNSVSYPQEEEEKEDEDEKVKDEEEEQTFLQELLEAYPFLSKQLSDPSAFVYLAPIDKSNAYRLMPIASKEDHAEYYCTLSSRGITSFIDNDSDFTTLAQFQREYQIFTALSNLTFFKQYRMWKTFAAWKRNVTLSKITDRKAMLEDSLFILHPLFRESLLSLRKLCWNAARFVLYDIPTEEPMSLSEFCSRQKEQKNGCEISLKEFWMHVRSLVRNACEEALRTFLVDNGFASEFNKTITFTERAAMRTQCRKLTKYIRLADFFVIDTFFDLALESTKNLLNSFNTRTSPLFYIDMSFDEVTQQLDFSPAEEKFRSKLENVIFDALGIVTAPQRLLTHPDFESYLIDDAVGANGGVDLSTMIVEDHDFQNIVESITMLLQRAFDTCSEFSQVFEPFLVEYVANEMLKTTLNIDHYIDASIETFSSLLKKYAEQIVTFSAMPTISDVAMVRILSNNLKARFEPSPRECLQSIHQLLPRVMRIKNESLLEEMTASNERVSKVSYSVDDFVELMRHLSALKNLSRSCRNVMSFRKCSTTCATNSR